MSSLRFFCESSVALVDAGGFGGVAVGTGITRGFYGVSLTKSLAKGLCLVGAKFGDFGLVTAV